MISKELLGLFLNEEVTQVNQELHQRGRCLYLGYNNIFEMSINDVLAFAKKWAYEPIKGEVGYQIITETRKNINGVFFHTSYIVNDTGLDFSEPLQVDDINSDSFKWHDTIWEAELEACEKIYEIV